MSHSSPPELPYELVEHRYDGYWGALWEGREGDERVLVRLVDGAELGEAARRDVADAVSRASTRRSELLLSMRSWTEAGGHCAVVSEYVDGVVLATVMRAAQQGEIELTVSLALGIARDVIAAVEELGGEDVGGLNPQQFMVCADGHTRMLEPGLAPLLRRCKAFSQQPERLGYDAPEAFQIGVEIGASAEVFSLGVMLWELMTNQRLFKGASTFKIIAQLRSGDIPRTDDGARSKQDPVPAEVADVIQRATEREAGDRYASVAELRQALEAATHVVAGAGAVAELVRALLPGELERVRSADALSARIAAKTERARQISARPPTLAGPARKRGPVRPLGPDVAVPTGRMADPRTRTLLWLAVALAVVVGVYRLAMQNRLAAEALYIMQAARPPQPSAIGAAAGAPSASAARSPAPHVRPVPATSASAEPDDPYGEIDVELAAPSATTPAPAAPKRATPSPSAPVAP